MNKFFVNRPIFAIVISLVIMLSGILSINNLAMEQYPDIAPPTVTVSATYRGADAQTVENSVTQIIEKEITGVDGMLYFSSSSNSAGTSTIVITFDQGTNPDTAQVQVQNRIQRIISRLPAAVQQNGVSVTKASSNMLMIVVLYDDTARDANNDISDYMVSNLQDPLSRVEGVGTASVMGGQQYAMRIWLDADKLRSYNLMPSDIQSAVLQQNTQIAAGKLGEQPSLETQNFTATVTAVSLLQTPEQFRNIIVKHNTDGALVRLGDVARIEMGSESYGNVSKFNGKPSVGISINLASGANALTTSNNVRALMKEIEQTLPDGYKIAFSNDNSSFVKTSIWEVVKTLLEAVALVIIVMFVFLGDWRSTIIPAFTVPVVLLGTFGVLLFFGYTINTLTLFAMVLSIGLLVDDAIVVVENVERLMREQNMTPKDAAIQSMSEVSSTLIGIAVVLSVVFIPMIFFGGSTGVIYRQFAVTIITAMALSVFVALTLTPALCGIILKQHKEAKETFFQKWFNKVTRNYKNGVGLVLKRSARMMIGFAVIIIAAVFVLMRMPTGFLPNEDQGIISVQFNLPDSAELSRSKKISDEIEKYFLENEKDSVSNIYMNAGYSRSGMYQNTGMGFINLKPWAQRKDKNNSASAIAARANKHFRSIVDAQVFVMVPPAIMSLSRNDGFDMYLQAAPQTSREELNQRRLDFLKEGAASSALAMVRSDSARSAPQMHINLDYTKAFMYGLSVNDIQNTLTSAWASVYINDFLDRGRIKRVYMQSDAQYRSKPDDLYRWTVRNSKGDMVPFSEFADTEWTYAPENLERFNGIASYNMLGTAAAGYSSGNAMNEVAKIASSLPGTTYSWAGLSYQENIASGSAGLLYALAILVVFLCLAALYESWSIPVSVLMVIPLGVLGTVLASQIRGLDNNIYFQMALLTTIGLSSKNAIMMVEFIESAHKQGKSLIDSAIEGATLRLRPILMTSFAFLAGVLPLALSSGVGANSRIAIGTGMVGGTFTATALAIFFVPLFFVLVRKVFSGKEGGASL